MHRAALLSLLLIASSALAEVYTYVDANGNRVFTDRPGTHASERIKVTPSNTMYAEPVQHSRRLSPPAQTKASYQQLRILTPSPDLTLRNTQELIVNVASRPALMPGHRYQLLLDGNPATTLDDGAALTLSQLHRGSYQLAVQILDEHGKSLERSANQTLHVRHTTLNDKRRTRPCQPDDFGNRRECPLKDKPAKKDIPFVPFM